MLCLRAVLRISIVALVTLGGGAIASAQSREQPREPVDDDSSLRSELKDATTRLDELHAELRRLHVRLKVAESQLPAPQADIGIVDALSNDFVVTAVHLWLDGVPIYTRDDDNGCVLGPAIHLLSGPLAPGDHVARIALRLRGNGALFPYLRGYRFELASSHRFTASVGRTATVTLRAFERGNEVTPYVQLPAVEWKDRGEAERRPL